MQRICIQVVLESKVKRVGLGGASRVYMGGDIRSKGINRQRHQKGPLPKSTMMSSKVERAKKVNRN